MSERSFHLQPLSIPHPPDPAAQWAGLRLKRPPGHLDELREPTASACVRKRPIFQAVGLEGNLGPELQDCRAQSLRRQIRDNGVTYNVYADADRARSALVSGPVAHHHHPDDWQQHRSRRAATHPFAQPHHGRHLRPP